MITGPTNWIVDVFNVDARYANHIPAGWTPLVYQTLSLMRELEPKVEFVQVKEKFAELRIYFDCQTKRYDELDKLVDEATEHSKHTCQSCGNYSETYVKRRNRGHWLVTLCDWCAEQQGAK